MYSIQCNDKIAKTLIQTKAIIIYIKNYAARICLAYANHLKLKYFKKGTVKKYHPQNVIN